MVVVQRRRVNWNRPFNMNIKPQSRLMDVWKYFALIETSLSAVHCADRVPFPIFHALLSLSLSMINTSLVAPITPIHHHIEQNKVSIICSSSQFLLRGLISHWTSQVAESTHNERQRPVAPSNHFSRMNKRVIRDAIPSCKQPQRHQMVNQHPELVGWNWNKRMLLKAWNYPGSCHGFDEVINGPLTSPDCP